MDKYRVRLRNGRVVGPFLPAEIIEMKLKGYVHGLESCQLFPSGDWLPLNQFEFWSDAPELNNSEGTFVINLGDMPDEVDDAEELDDLPTIEELVDEPLSIEEEAPPAAAETTSETPASLVPQGKERRKRPRQSFREFDYRQAINRREESNVFELEDYSELPDDVSPLVAKEAARHKDQGEVSKRILKVKTKELSKEVQEELRRQKRLELEAQRREIEDGRTIVTPAAQEWRRQLEEEKRKQEAIQAELARKEKERQEKLAQTPAISDLQLRDGATEVISLGTLNELRSEARHAEVDMLNYEKREEEVRQKELAQENKAKIAALEAKEEEIRQEQRAKRKKQFVVLAAVVLGLALLFPADEGPKKPKAIVPIEPVISFPVPFTDKDPVKAKSQREAGEAKLKLDTYLGRRDGTILLRSSYENNIDQRDLIPKLIRLYGWLIPHSGQFERDGSVVFKLARANKLQLPIDPDVCLGTALFYKASGKKEAAFNVLDRFVKSKSNKPSKELFAAYLESLVDQDEEVVADEVAASLEKVERKGIEVTLALIRYHRYKNHPEKAREALDTSLVQHKNSAPLLIARAEFELEANDLKALNTTVQQLRAVEAEKSRLYFGRLMEFAGFVLAFQGKSDQAAAAFKEALKYSNSDLLQDKLTNIKNLDPSASDEASKLIKQIQARELVKESERALKAFDFQNALLYAINAQGLDSGYIKATYHLAHLQLRLGMTKDGLDTLETIQKENPGDKEANIALLGAYIDTYKFNDAKRMFTILASSDMRETWQYASLNARMYEKMGEIGQSILWLQKAINLNPLNDEDIFSLAKLLIRAKNFGQAKNRLFQAMELDPSRIDYKLAYGSIIYETDGPDAAISYLFSLLQQHPKNPSILGDIAIYYYRAGKTQQFQDMRKDIQALPVQDPRVYRFLIRTSILDEKWDEAEKYTNELVKLEPGDLNSMMEMGRVLMALKKYREAATWFVRVRDKLSSYPKVGYYKGLIEQYLGNSEQAMKDVSEDMRLNGQYEEGVVLIGDIYRVQEKFAEAEAQYKIALKINTRSAGAHRGLASLAFKRGSLDLALELFKKALTEEKDNPEVHRQLGDIYRLQGQAQLAIESYKVYLKLRPDAPDRPEVDNHIRTLE